MPPARSGGVRQVWRFDAIGTVWRIESPQPLPDAVRAAVSAEIDAFDRTWSRFRGDSLVTALSSGGEAPIPVDAAPMLDAYAELSDATGGGINPLVGASLAHRGYDADYSLVDRGPLPAPADWRDVVAWSDDRLRVERPALVDVGALGKGRLVDRVLAVLTSAVAGELVVDAGGDIAVHAATERVALQHPFDHSRAIGLWEVTGGALCASATDRRAWGAGLHHVLDARTGQPVRTTAATWARAADAMTADAVATALFFDGGPRLAARWNAAWVRMSTDGRVEWSPGCDADLFIRN